MFLDRVDELLQARGVAVKRYRKPTFTRPAPTPTAASGNAPQAAHAAAPSKSGVRGPDHIDDFVLTGTLGVPWSFRDS